MHSHAILVQRHYLALRNQFFVPMELRFHALVFQPCRYLELSRRARLFALTCHGIIKTNFINNDTMLTTYILCQVERKAIGVMQSKSNMSHKDFWLKQLSFISTLSITRSNIKTKATRYDFIECYFKHFHTMLNSLKKTLFLDTQYLTHPRLRCDQLGIRSAHFPGKINYYLMEKCCAATQFITMSDGTADNAAQHIAAPFITGNHSIHD